MILHRYLCQKIETKIFVKDKWLKLERRIFSSIHKLGPQKIAPQIEKFSEEGRKILLGDHHPPPRFHCQEEEVARFDMTMREELDPEAHEMKHSKLVLVPKERRLRFQQVMKCMRR